MCITLAPRPLVEGTDLEMIDSEAVNKGTDLDGPELP
jgi:hypothetical protein